MRIRRMLLIVGVGAGAMAWLVVAGGAGGVGWGGGVVEVALAGRGDGDAAGAARAALQRAKKGGNLLEVESALEALMQMDAAGAKEEAWGMASASAAVVRPIGSAFMARHAGAEELIAAVRRMDARRAPDERRWLVRALGGKGGEGTRVALEGMLGDSDLLVRVAAAAALGELGDVAAERALRRVMPSRPPVESGSWGGDEKAALEMVASGAVAALRRVAAGEQEGDGAKGEGPKPVKVRGQEALPTERFLLFFKAKEFGGMTAEGELAWPEFSAMVDGAAAQAVAAAGPILGEVPMPPIRLLLADDRQFSGLAGVPTGFGGVCKGNEIVLRLGLPRAMMVTLHHEYVHAVHGATFGDQPRWMSEGLAESLTKSGEGSVWTMAGARAAGLGEMVGQGAVTRAMAWKTGAVSGPREGQMYGVSHLVVDFLRFGPFSAREARLAALMGRLSRGEPAAGALRELYGEARELDEMLRAWLLENKPPVGE